MRQNGVETWNEILQELLDAVLSSPETECPSNECASINLYSWSTLDEFLCKKIIRAVSNALLQ